MLSTTGGAFYKGKRPALQKLNRHQERKSHLWDLYFLAPYQGHEQQLFEVVLLLAVCYSRSGCWQGPSTSVRNNVTWKRLPRINETYLVARMRLMAWNGLEDIVMGPQNRGGIPVGYRSIDEAAISLGL